MPAATWSSQVQVIFMPPCTFSIFMVQRGTIIMLGAAGMAPVPMPGMPMPGIPMPDMPVSVRPIIIMFVMAELLPLGKRSAGMVQYRTLPALGCARPSTQATTTWVKCTGWKG